MTDAIINETELHRTETDITYELKSEQNTIQSQTSEANKIESKQTAQEIKETEARPPSTLEKPPMCGHTKYRKLMKPKIQLRVEPETIIGSAITVPVYTCYLGQVPLPCTDRGSGNVALMSTQSSTFGPNVLVKQVSGRLNNLDPTQTYDVDDLKNLPTMVVNIAQCESNWQIIQNLKPIQNKTPQQAQQLQQAMSYNAQVDVQFLMCKYLEFLHEQVGMNCSTPSNCLLGIVDVPNFDNAFWSGSYCVFGSGNEFYPLVPIDVVFHECSHGLIQTIAGLDYVLESGALDESYADIFGESGETWMSTQPEPIGETPVVSVWTIGAEACHTMSCIRDMSNPNRCQQPFNYKGWFWASPDSDSSLYVHQNSGTSNYLFYQATQTLGRTQAFALFLNCLKQLQPDSNYLDFRDIMRSLGMPQSCLNACSLIDGLVSDQPH